MFAVSFLLLSCHKSVAVVLTDMVNFALILSKTVPLS
jgi:hypothetical protein